MMKHRQTSVTKVGLVNSDGHAIGIDIGATAVRAAILSPGMHEGRPSVTVHGLGQAPLPEGAVVNGVVANRSQVTQACKDLWQANKFECRNVIVGITNQQIVVRDMQMPNLPPEQLAKALPFRAKEIIALPIDQALIDFTPLGPAENDMVHGLLIATPREPVLAAVDAVERAGLKVARVDLSSFAALRSIAEEHHAVEAVIDMGAHLTNIVIHNQGIPKVVRTVTRGGNELTEKLADRMELSLLDAEIAKWDNGLNGSHPEVSRTLTDSIRPLIAEIRSSIHYFTSVGEGAQIERISLTGGGSALGGFADSLAEQMGVPVGVITPMQHIRNRWASKQTNDDNANSWASAVSVGLAMGAAA